LDHYEPQFFIRTEDWEANKWSVKLTLNDSTYIKDIFYFCHIHNNMSGRIKMVDVAGAVLQVADTPVLGYTYEVPSVSDASCGT